VAWAVALAVAVLVAERLTTRARRRWPVLDRTDGVVAALVVVAWLAAVAAATYRLVDGTDDYGPSQHTAAVLVRYGGAVGVALGLVALLVAPWRAKPSQQPWLVVGAAAVLLAALKEGIRYELYYARYLVADAVPVLVIAGAWSVGEGTRRIAARWGPWPAAGAWALALLTWLVPPLRLLDRPVFWIRDLAHGPEDLAAMLERVPDDAVLFFDSRMPGRWRGILATPAFLAFGKRVLVYPDGRMLEGLVGAGTPVLMISGGWEPDDHQRWPENGPWRTTVIARGYYRAQRAEIVEGDVPRALTEWGGPWELHRVDPSIWRGHGALSLLPGSRFIASSRPGELRTVPIELRWEAGARVELRLPPYALDGCTASAAMEGPAHALSVRPIPAAELEVVLPRVSDPDAAMLVFAMPPPPPALPVTAALVVRWTCETPVALPWRRLSMRWERG
jgi:hypothetical protein